jgi:DNA-binding MarR family transcriptional regulator
MVNATPEPGPLPATDSAETGPQGRHIAAVVQSFRLIFRSIQDHSRGVERRCGVSAAQLWAMWELLATPGMRVSELSRAMSIHQSTASNLLDKLEAKGLARRERRGPDHRVVRLYLTDKGTKLVGRAPRPAQGALSSALAGLGIDTLQQLDANLAALVALMSVEDATGAALEPLAGD